MTEQVAPGNTFPFDPGHPRPGADAQGRPLPAWLTPFIHPGAPDLLGLTIRCGGTVTVFLTKQDALAWADSIRQMAEQVSGLIVAPNLNGIPAQPPTGLQK